MGPIGYSNLRYIRAEEGDKVDIFMTHIIMTEVATKIDTDQIVVTEEISIDKIEVDWGMNKIIDEEILEAVWDHIRISEDTIAEENTEVIIVMKVTAEKEVGAVLEKDHFQGITIIIEVQVIVDQGLDWEWVQIEIELSVINVENMIISWKIALNLRKKKNRATPANA